jgi:ribosome-associated toxin RatA of RatAB toxin-antitoxin module
MRLLTLLGIYHFFSLLILFNNVNLIAAKSSNLVSFPNERGENYLIRLIETKGSSSKTLEAIFTVSAKPQKIISIVSDFKHYPQFMPNIVSTVFLGDSGGGAIWAFGFKVALFTIHYKILVKSQYSDTLQSITWNYIAGDIKKTEGLWNVSPCNNDTTCSLVFYRNQLDLGMGIPMWLVTSLSQGSIPALIASIRKKAAVN